MGRPAVYEGEALFLFKLSDFELFLGGPKTRSCLPGEWRDYFGIPVKDHEQEYKVDLANGYITSDKI